MQFLTGQRLIRLLGWLADRPRGSAAAAVLLLAFCTSLIRAPDIRGSMLDQMSGTNARVEIARRIAAASGDEPTAAVIVTPGDVSIGDVFAGLATLQAAFTALDGRISLRSVDSARSQLFVYDLNLDSPVHSLLGVLRDHSQSATAINADATKFLIVITSPESLQLEVLAVLSTHDWGAVFAETKVLASAQLERDVAAGLERDLRLLIPVIVAVTLLALLLAFGRWQALLLPLFASIASTLVTFSLFSAFEVTINLVTLLALPVVLIVGLANSCHFLAKSGSDRRGSGDVAVAVRKTLQRVGPPFFFSTLTTSIALVSLGLNELPPIANLGLLSAASLLVVFVLVLLAAPLLLRWYLSACTGTWQDSRVFHALSRWLGVWRTHISGLLLLGMVAGAVCVPLLTVKSEPRAFFPDNAPFSSALKMFEQEFYVFSPLRVLVSVDNGAPLAALRSAGEIRNLLAEHAGIRQVTMRPALNDTSTFVLSALLASKGDLAAVQLDLDAAVAGGADLVYSSAALVYGDIDRRAIDSLLRSFAWSVALIFGAVLFVFRSFRALLGTMLANAVPLLLVCGAVWLIGNPLNLVTVFVFLVALGIVVDDSIHILFWRAAGDSVSGSSIEFSVLLSTAMLCIGLLLCQLSAFPTTRQFAAYCALALVGAVVSNLSVLPLLLGQQPQHEPAT